MTKPWNKSREELCKMIDELFDIIDDLSEWAYDFVNSMVEWGDSDREFTDAQAQKIEELYKQHCA